MLHFFRSPVAWLPAQDISPEDQRPGLPGPVLSRGQLLSGVDDSSSKGLGRSSEPDMSKSHVSECVCKPDEDHMYLHVIWTNYWDQNKFLESLI